MERGVNRARVRGSIPGGRGFWVVSFSLLTIAHTENQVEFLYMKMYLAVKPF